MCWKHEWARAVNNINWALIHIERARLKVEKRSNPVAVQECLQLQETLNEVQMRLKDLIRQFGITRVQGEKSTQTKMTGARKRRGRIEAWIQKY